MKTKWILLGIALVLAVLLWTTMRREGFENATCPDGGQFMLVNDGPKCISATDVEDRMPPPAPPCVAGKVYLNGQCRALVPYTGCSGKLMTPFVGSGGIATPPTQCIPSGTDTYAVDLPSDPAADMPTCRAGYTLYSPTDLFVTRKMQCVANGSSAAPAAASAPRRTEGPPPAKTKSAPSPFMTGTSTGGSSTSLLGPNSGGGGDRRKQVFGPLFTSHGEVSGRNGQDSSKTNVYPQLLGGGDAKPSTRTDAGIQPAKDKGDMPSDSSLGATEDSKYFPTSRVPGDMDLIPDPYRVSQTFSATNYSFKTEPVPFLTDFSAFQK